MDLLLERARADLNDIAIVRIAVVNGRLNRAEPFARINVGNWRTNHRGTTGHVGRPQPWADFERTHRL